MIGLPKLSPVVKCKLCNRLYTMKDATAHLFHQHSLGKAPPKIVITKEKGSRYAAFAWDEFRHEWHTVRQVADLMGVHQAIDSYRHWVSRNRDKFIIKMVDGRTKDEMLLKRIRE
jgi:hypothetical protein